MGAKSRTKVGRPDMKPRRIPRAAIVACVTALLHGFAVRPADATWQVFSAADGLLNNSPQQFMEDRSGGYWVGFEFNGLQRFDGKTFSRFASSDGKYFGVRIGQ